MTYEHYMEYSVIEKGQYDARADSILATVSGLLKEEGVKIVKKGVPLTTIYGPSNHWLRGVVFVGFEGVRIDMTQKLIIPSGYTQIRIPSTTDKSEIGGVALRYLSIKDIADLFDVNGEKIKGPCGIITTTTTTMKDKPVGTLDLTPAQFKCQLPKSGKVRIENAYLVHFSDRFLKQNLRKHGNLAKTALFVTQVARGSR